MLACYLSGRPIDQNAKETYFQAYIFGADPAALFECVDADRRVDDLCNLAGDVSVG